VRGVRSFTILAALAVSAGAGCGAAAAKVPQGFVGMAADGPLFDSQVNLTHQLNKMVGSGVERLRVSFNWADAQPYKSWSDVPASQRSRFTNVGGVPTDFGGTDEIMTAAAAHRLAVLPVVLFAPRWDGSPKGNHVQPVHDRPYGRYLTALVKRYGPSGTFWAANPSLPFWPIRSWQIWNEPELTFYWDTGNFAPSYVALLRVAHDAVKKADPSAKVVLGSLTNYAWKDLQSIYMVHGARGLFDAVGSNPYTSKPTGVIRILTNVRRAMDDHGDRAKPLIATEVGWPSALGKTKQNFGFNTTEQGQAKNLSQLLPLLASNRQRLGLSSFYYYTWLSTDQRGAVSWAFSGLLRFDSSTGVVSAKPAFKAFRRTALKLEGCRKKTSPLACS
jgi:polysaccharide biosynthesis protein PslG